MRTLIVWLMTGGLLAGAAIAGEPDASSATGDSELVRAAAGGDMEAFTQLYDRHARAVYSLLRRMLRDEGQAEDLTQDVFLTLWQQAGRFDPQARSALPWLLVVARNRALDRLRSAPVRREETREAADLEVAALPAPGARSGATPGTIEARIWTAEVFDRVRDLWPSLSGDERTVLELAYFEGMSQSAISARMGAPLGTVKSWARSGLGKLRRSLAGEGARP